jgi:outer membrane immunogenic protein
MNRLLSATLAVLGLGVALPAGAADLPTAFPTKAPALAALYNWTGFYVGANLGYGWANGTDSFTVNPGGATVGTSGNLSGIVGGGQLGYNWQVSSLVFGIEGDLDAADQSRTAAAPCGAGCTVSATDRVRWFGTIRGRVGFAADRWLFYVTGGAAWQNLSNSVTVTAPPFTFASSGSTTRGGWVLGQLDRPRRIPLDRYRQLEHHDAGAGCARRHPLPAGHDLGDRDQPGQEQRDPRGRELPLLSAQSSALEGPAQAGPSHLRPPHTCPAPTAGGLWPDGTGRTAPF